MVIEGGGKGATKYFEYFRSRIFSRDVNRISIAETDCFSIAATVIYLQNKMSRGW